MLADDILFELREIKALDKFHKDYLIRFAEELEAKHGLDEYQIGEMVNAYFHATDKTEVDTLGEITDAFITHEKESWISTRLVEVVKAPRELLAYIDYDKYMEEELSFEGFIAYDDFVFQT